MTKPEDHVIAVPQGAGLFKLVHKVVPPADYGEPEKKKGSYRTVLKLGRSMKTVCL